jgi:hypothetical protein
MNWKQSLDRYLTTEPDNGFDGWCDDVLGHKISDTFYNDNAEWVECVDGQCNKWLNKLFDKGINTDETAMIIERAYRLYLTN